MVNEIITSFTRFRGKGRWPPSIRGLAAYRMRRAHPYGGIGKWLQRRGQILWLESRARLLRHSLRAWSSSMVGMSDQSTRTSCSLQRKTTTPYDVGSAPFNGSVRQAIHRRPRRVADPLGVLLLYYHPHPLPYIIDRFVRSCKPKYPNRGSEAVALSRGVIPNQWSSWVFVSVCA